MYLAHKSEDNREQELKEHLINTSVLAGKFAAAFHNHEWGELCGMLHDIGKYSDEFQERIHGAGLKVDHSTAGAIEIKNMGYKILSYCVAGHHTGLPDGGNEIDPKDSATLCGRLKKEVKDYKKYSSEISINMPLEPPSINFLGKGSFTISFFIRLLYSCLVDADFLDTESFMSNGNVERAKYDSIETLNERLQKHIEPWLREKNGNTLNVKRTAILKHCIEKGLGAQGLYSLTVPTGGGKTISSLAFALQHAKKNNMDRVIYVIPYTSIIEQNAAVFSRILGNENVLEHHSNINYEDDLDNDKINIKKLATENWDMPIVVTTNIQFFESLYGNKSSKCRKLHNIANSVIIFDEAQMLSNEYLMPCIRAMSELVYNYHSTLVLCTATQPALHKLFPTEIQCHEIYTDYDKEASCFQRVFIEQAGTNSVEEIVQKINQYKQVLCIVNSRRSAQSIYKGMEQEGVFHLSTLMYPVHRRRVLDEIRECLKQGKCCRVVSTSLIEAGVDIDFPVVFRELAGVDSVIQAAGRCNREGIRPVEESKVFVFELQDADVRVPSTLKQPISISRMVMQKFDDLSSQEAIQHYFEQLHYVKGDGLDKEKIVDAFENNKSGNYPFLTVARKFHLIDNNTKSIIINKEQEAEELITEITCGKCSRSILRKLGQYSIDINEYLYKKLQEAGMLKQLDEEICVLREKDVYKESIGLELDLNIERGDAFFA